MNNNEEKLRIMAERIVNLQSKLKNREYSKEEINEMIGLTDQLENKVDELEKLYKGK